MKKIIPFIIILISILSSCKQEANTEGSKAEPALDPSKEMWAEVVETKTMLVKPEGWDDAYWQSVNKKMDSHKMFNTIVEAVISGKKQAYDLFTDSVLTIAQVKEMVNTGSEGTETGKVNADDLSLIRMREKWVFDKEKFILEKQVTRIDLVYKKLDENGEYIGDKPLFYVNLNQ
ncbi:MAG: hypothetical protein V4608_06780 [Bacteroidota bacterium]